MSTVLQQHLDLVRQRHEGQYSILELNELAAERMDASKQLGISNVKAEQLRAVGLGSLWLKAPIA